MVVTYFSSLSWLSHLYTWPNYPNNGDKPFLTEILTLGFCQNTQKNREETHNELNYIKDCFGLG